MKRTTITSFIEKFPLEDIYPIVEYKEFDRYIISAEITIGTTLIITNDGYMEHYPFTFRIEVESWRGYNDAIEKFGEALKKAEIRFNEMVVAHDLQRLKG